MITTARSYIKPALGVVLLLIIAAGCNRNSMKDYPRAASFRNFLTLTLGKPAIDFELQTLSGKLWRLSDHYDKAIVLQFASSTSPAFVQGLDPFQREVLSRYPLNDNLLFVYVFTTEAHPELLSQENRMEFEQDPQKFMRKAACEYYYRLTFSSDGKYDLSGLIPAARNVVILVDTANGYIGRQYGYGRGGTTNPSFLIIPNGTLALKALNVVDFLSPTGFLAGNLPMRLDQYTR